MMKRMTPRTIVGALAILMLAAAAHGAQPFPMPTVDFEADLKMSVRQGEGGQPYVINGKVHASNGNELREISHMGRTTSVLKLKDKEASYTLIHSQKTYMANQGKDRRDPERMIRDGDLKFTKVGRQEKGGHDTNHYTFASKDNAKETFEGDAWFTAKENIPVLIVAKSSNGQITNHVRIVYDNILKKKQPARLFKIPDDYRALNTGMPTGVPAGMGAPGGKMPPGLSPEQMEQLKKMLRKKQGG